MHTNTLMDEFGDMLDMWNAFAQYPLTKKPFENEGLKHLIKRPHNIYTIKDDDGNITSYRIEVTTTPFKKDDIIVEVQKDMLVVTCGAENHKDIDDKYLSYHGISSQSFNFSVKLVNIDLDKITAKNEDGILRIELPVLDTDVVEVKQIKID